jgi:serine phosphatase RsbU (regulator of sigma subunit)/tetratricopeptide (TPR) repeat protein
MYKLFKVAFFSIFFGVGLSALSQQRIIDSLEKCLTKIQVDTQRVNTLQELCRKHLFSDSKKALNYGKLAFDLSEKINFKKGAAKALHNMGIVYYNTGGYDSALYYFFNSLKIKQTLGDKKGMASSYNNIGAILAFKGDYDKALGYYISSLKINEDLKNDEGALSAANNIGNILSQQHNPKGAINYYRISLDYSKKAENNKGVADALLNIGSVHFDINSNDSALFYYNLAKPLYIEEADQERVATLYNSFGLWYDKMNQSDSACRYFEKAKRLYASVDNLQGLAEVYEHLGQIYLNRNDLLNANTYFTEGLSFTKKLGVKDLEASYYESLAKLYAKKGEYVDAYKYHVLFYNIKDSLITKESLKQIADMHIKYESEKKEQQINLLSKDKELQEITLKKHELIILCSIVGLLIAIFISLFIGRSLKITHKQKNIIEKQKKLVEEKNRDIIDSINYAKRIQLALLKEEEHVSEHLPEHFILFKPKDIVSGDFYWAIEKNEYWYLAAADCTGHGVPGAFMSMLGIALLNEISASTDFLSPAQILDQLRAKIVKDLGQKGKDGDSKDGMDISLVCYNMNTKQLQWAGANNPLYVFRGHELSIIKANKQSIGFQSDMQPFTNHTINLESGDTFYLFTDGYADQFGGPHGKKYKYSKLKERLISISSEPMEKQKTMLTNEFLKWKSDFEQTDDVCIIGARI